MTDIKDYVLKTTIPPVQKCPSCVCPKVKVSAGMCKKCPEEQPEPTFNIFIALIFGNNPTKNKSKKYGKYNRMCKSTMYRNCSYSICKIRRKNITIKIISCF